MVGSDLVKLANKITLNPQTEGCLIWTPHLKTAGTAHIILTYSSADLKMLSGICLCVWWLLVRASTPWYCPKGNQALCFGATWFETSLLSLLSSEFRTKISKILQDNIYLYL